jgi:hypothetical protein
VEHPKHGYLSTVPATTLSMEFTSIKDLGTEKSEVYDRMEDEDGSACSAWAQRRSWFVEGARPLNGGSMEYCGTRDYATELRN